MPIVLVRALRPESPASVDDALAGAVSGLAAAIGCPPGDVWASFEPVDAMHVGPRVANARTQCPMVTVLARAGRSEAHVATGLAAVAEAVAKAFSVPVEDVWLEWRDLPPGRVFAGGSVR